MANPIQFDRFKPSSNPECLRCEELLADAVDDVLSPADQAFFDRHLAGCTDCMAALADAKRGAAWLEMLKTPRPEPSAHLLERILAETSGAEAQGATGITLAPAGAFVEPVYPPNVLPFRPRMPLLQPQHNRLTRILFEPRLAMTAAMAFFSIALTMNLTGVRLNQLHASDLQPDHLEHTYYQATAFVARRYEGLRVVHTLESRVDDLRQANRDGRDDNRDNSQDRLGGLSERPEKTTAPPKSQQPEPQQPEPQKTDPQKSEPGKGGVSRTPAAPGAHLMPVLEAAPATSTMKKEGGLA